MVQWCLGSDSFFSSWWHGSTRPNSEQLLQPSCTVPCPSSVPQTLRLPLQINKIPFAICYLVNFFSSALTSSCLSSSFLWVFSSWCFLAVPTTSLLLLYFLLDTLGLKWKYQAPAHHTALYSQVHKSASTCRGCTHTTMSSRHVN